MEQMPEETDSLHEAETTRRKDYELFHEGVLGRCPECGRLIMLPCLACAVRETEMEFTEETPPDIGLGLELGAAEQKRYENIRKYRNQYGMSLFDDELFVERAWQVFCR